MGLPLSESLEKPSSTSRGPISLASRHSLIFAERGQTQVSLNPLQEIFKENISELLGAIAAKTNNEA